MPREYYAGTWQKERAYSPVVVTTGGRVAWLAGDGGIAESDEELTGQSVELERMQFATDFDAQVCLRERPRIIVSSRSLVGADERLLPVLGSSPSGSRCLERETVSNRRPSAWEAPHRPRRTAVKCRGVSGGGRSPSLRRPRSGVGPRGVLGQHLVAGREGRVVIGGLTCLARAIRRRESLRAPSWHGSRWLLESTS